jgi:DeoR family glycerol-3-phosphate regulon repressor
MVLSDELSNRILLPGGELRLPDRDIIGEETVDFFSRFRAEFAIYGVAGVAEDGGLMDFHPAEVRARRQMQSHTQTSILVLDQSKFGRIAPALGGSIGDSDRVVVDRSPGSKFLHLLEPLGGRLIYAESGIDV